MSSSVFFRFKSQKEPSRVVFDGTGISVFELKREIITMNRLGDGTDFELIVSSEDTNEVYDDDTSIIPRSTTVIAKRLPPAKPGRGGAARYVAGKMPQNAKSSHRMEAITTKTASSSYTTELVAMNGAQTEEQKVAAMFKVGADQWAQQQQEMANATPVHRSGPNKGKLTNIPDHSPPPGYICYRCGEKGHWIQMCPTNDDPTYENRPRVKRTTGIPRSFLKTIEKPAALANDGTIDDTKQPAGVMVNAEGEWVIAEPDKASWDQYQAKARISAVAQETAKQGSKDLQDRGLECSIDKRLFVDPTTTPCCQATFCHDCITNALLENDLRCPECSTENILIDDLVPNEDINARIRSYEEAKACTQLTNEDSITTGAAHQWSRNSPPNNANIRKRAADSDLENERAPVGPSKDAAQRLIFKGERPDSHKQIPATTPNVLANPVLPFSNGNYMMPQGINPMTLPTMNNFMPIGMTMDQAMTMNVALPHPMAMSNGASMGNDWNMWGGGMHTMNMMGSVSQNDPTSNATYDQRNHPMSLNGTNGMSFYGQGTFANQQRSTNDEDSAYFRKPVNPHRHQTRRNVQRPMDYREI